MRKASDVMYPVGIDQKKKAGECIRKKRKKCHLEECGVRCSSISHHKAILFCGACNLEICALLCFVHVSCVSCIRVWCVSVSILW